MIYQAYLISSTTTSHELIEQVLKRADIVDDPYRYYVYENCMDENSSKLFLTVMSHLTMHFSYVTSLCCIFYSQPYVLAKISLAIEDACIILYKF